VILFWNAGEVHGVFGFAGMEFGILTIEYKDLRALMITMLGGVDGVGGVGGGSERGSEYGSEVGGS